MRPWLVPWFLVAVALSPGRVLAQFVIIREAQAVAVDAPAQDPAAPDGVVEEDVAVQAAPVVGFVMNDAQFDMWVFGSSRNTGGRNRLEGLLDLNVDEVARQCHLSGLNRQKLLLAGRGDIKRFFDRVDEKRKKFDKVKTDQNKIGEMYQELLPLQAALQSGLFGEGSLYSKTLKRILGDTGEASYQETLRAKNLFRYRAKVELVVAQLDQVLGLSDGQRHKLVETILRESQPPIRYGQYDYYLILYQAGRIHRDKLRPLFEAKQWEFFVRQLDQMRGMDQFLRNQGLLPERNEAKEIAEAFADALRKPARGHADLPADVFAGEGTKAAVAREEKP